MWYGSVGNCGNYFQYKQISTPAALPLDLDFVKSYLRIDSNDDDALITMLIKASASFIEKYTTRTLINTQYLTYRDNFGYGSFAWGFPAAYGCCGIELRRSKLVSIDNFTYKNSQGVVTQVDPSLYYVTDDVDFSSILLMPNRQYPSDVLCVRQAIAIEFTAGYGDTADDIPIDLQEAMLQMVADMYFNRGDCVAAGRMSCSCQKYLSGASKAILDQYKIVTI